MQNAQFETIIAMLAGMQTAIVQLCRTLDQKGVASLEELTASLKAGLDGISADHPQRVQMQLVLQQIAYGLRRDPPPQH